jgi:hypothetical protein
MFGQTGWECCLARAPIPVRVRLHSQPPHFFEGYQTFAPRCASSSFASPSFSLRKLSLLLPHHPNAYAFPQVKNLYRTRRPVTSLSPSTAHGQPSPRLFYTGDAYSNNAPEKKDT